LEIIPSCLLKLQVSQGICVALSFAIEAESRLEASVCRFGSVGPIMPTQVSQVSGQRRDYGTPLYGSNR